MEIILISGGTASGKSTFSKKLFNNLNNNKNNVQLLELDMFYPVLDLKNKNIEDYDLDTIEALDLDLFLTKIYELYTKKSTYIPYRDFKNGTVIHNHTYINKPNILIIEGMLIHSVFLNLHKYISISKLNHMNISKEYIKDMCNYILKNSYNLFISAHYDTEQDAKIRLNRRIKRDVIERNVSEEKTKEMWNKILKSHNKYVEPQKYICHKHITIEDFEESLIEISNYYLCKLPHSS